MTLEKDYIDENICLFDCYSNEHPEAYKDTLFVAIDATGTLEKEADRIRKEEGFLPMFEGEAPDLEGWYEFGIYSNRDKVIEMGFVVQNSSQDDCSKYYEIPLDDQTKMLLHRRLVALFGTKAWSRAFDKQLIL